MEQLLCYYCAVLLLLALAISLTIFPFRVGKQVLEFESIYLSDIDSGNLIVQDMPYGLEGKRVLFATSSKC